MTELIVKQVDTKLLWEIKWSRGPGSVPRELSGYYANPTQAQDAIELFYKARDNKVKRRHRGPRGSE